MKFVANVPVATSAPTIVVDAGLAVGTHRFQLVVFNAHGQASKPATFDVVIAAPIVVPVTPVVPIGPPLP